ncbi:S53 family peptidase [Amycolatopsis acidiphila]|uniref:Peptidase S53 domain-containing protein n=1 Tax=Amycolatopsis acidiphila TaxID=715473 RepID=A0A557ZZ64_9PSEU|nr:S53 family peptidase [Amycolatopsis acidiphila]TVT17305.1 hypothetical protein FNH06_32020 [Amycolatopsis acidiphila]
MADSFANEPTPLRRSGLRRRRGLALAAVIALGVSIAQTPIAAAADTPVFRPVGAAPAVPNGAVRLTEPQADQPVRLNVELAPRDPAALQAFVTAVSTPDSPQYHQYLQKGQFAAVFGPTRTTIDAVTTALEAQGLNPGAASPDGLSIPVDTTFGNAARALRVGFAGYRLTDGRTTYANTNAPELPSSVAGVVTGILGLNDFTKPVAQHTPGTRTVAAPKGSVQPHAAQPNVATPSFCSDIKNLLSSNGLTDTQDYWEPSTLSASYAYNTAPLYNQYGNTGSGVSVGLFELENYSPDDIAAYESCFGLRTSVSATKVDGGPTLPPDMNTQVGLESALDIQTVAGLAPGVGIKVYQGPDNANSTQYLDVYRRIVNDDAVQVISTSWGLCETNAQAWDPALLSTEANLFAMAAAQGQTVVAASGDSGSTGCYPVGPDNSSLVVDDPAAQPNVTAVGGTRMTLPSGGSSVVQSTWNTPGEQPGASGGGVSQYQKLSGAGNFQSGVQGAGYSNVCAAAAGTTCRQVPDVSALADPGTGYLTAFGEDTNSQYWTIIGGTSGAAPLWAAIMALTDASGSCAGNGAVGMVNPALYQHANLLTDVTAGNNILDGSGYTGNLYSAGSGYDLTTGLGTPKAPALVEALCSAKAASVGSSFTPVTPARVLDTRSAGPIGAGGTLKLPVTGANGVPSSGVTAVVLNVTATESTDGGFLTLYPDGQPRPASSNLNFVAGQTIPNLVTIPVGSDGAVDIYNRFGTVQVIADIFGYFTNDGTGYRFHTSTPQRLLDTRNGQGVTSGQATPVGTGGVFALPLTDTAGPGNTGPLAGAAALMLNVTATESTDGGFLTVYPSNVARPASSNLNYVAGQTIPNAVVTPVNGSAIDFYNRFGTVQIIADLFGYYSAN